MDKSRNRTNPEFDLKAPFDPEEDLKAAFFFAVIAVFGTPKRQRRSRGLVLLSSDLVGLVQISTRGLLHQPG